MGTVYFTLTKGNKGDVVPESSTIYNSQSCTKPIRIGKKKVVVKKETPDISLKDLSSIELILTDTTGGLIEESANQYITGMPVQIPASAIEEAILENFEDFADIYDAIDAQVETPTGVKTILTWLDDMIAFVDALPTLYSDGAIVYEVEKNDIGEYIYNGQYGVINAEWNEAVQKAKAKVCRKLNAAIDRVTDNATSWLNSVMADIMQSEVALKLIDIFRGKGISIDTVVGIVKGIVKFCTWWYQLFYQIYTTAMMILEAVVVKVPQLISKISSKLLEFDCSITAKMSKTQIELPSNKKK